MALSSGNWTGTARDAFQSTASVSMSIAVTGNTFSGTIAVTPNVVNPPTYNANITGTINGNQVTISEDPSSNTFLSGMWTDTPYSQTGALQAIFGTIAPGATPNSASSGGGPIMLFFRG